MGILYAEGQGVKEDFEKAREYFQLSAKQNNSDALCFLGKVYEEGLGVPKDHLKAKYYYELAAKQNNSYACVYLASLYMKDKSIPENFSKMRPKKNPTGRAEFQENC